MPAPSVVSTVEAYRTVMDTTRDAARTFAAARWSEMSSWSDEAADQLVRQVVPVVEAAERTSAAATVAYVGRLTGSRPKVDLATVTGAAVRRGVDPLEVYRRPIVEARAHYAKNQLVEDAVSVGMRRLLGNVELDTQRAASMAAQAAMGRAGVKEYRRVTHAGACPLCIAASDRVYYVSDLLPVHTNCHCLVLPGSRVPDRLKPENRGDDRGLRITDHGEIGPVLEWDEAYPLAKGGSRRKPPAKPTPEEIIAGKRAQLEAYEKLVAEGKGTDFTREKIDQLRAELGVLPEPATLSEKIAALRDDYRGVSGDWVAGSPEDIAKLEEIRDQIKAQITARYAQLQQNAAEYAREQGRSDFSNDLYRLERTDFELAKLRSQLDRADVAYRQLAAPKLGSSAAADQRFDTIMAAGDEMLAEVTKRVEARVAASAVSPEELAVRAGLEKELAKATAKYQKTKTAAVGPIERRFFKELFDLDITLDEYWDLPDPPAIGPDDLQRLMDLRSRPLVSNPVWKAEQTERKARKRLRAFDDAQADRTGVAWRKAVTETLAEVRPMGGTGSAFVSPATGKELARGRVKEALEQACQSYPTEWLAAQKARFPALAGKKVKRGYFQKGGQRVQPEIALSESYRPALGTVDPDGMLDVAVHEIGHSMEYSIPDIARLEWLFLRRRVIQPDGTYMPRTRIYGSEYGYHDDFTNHYTGKTYSRGLMPGQGKLDVPEQAYELFTTGTQALFTGELKRFAMGKNGDKLDEDFIRFMLGVMSVV